jgi:hypothetical protein
VSPRSGARSADRSSRACSSDDTGSEASRRAHERRREADEFVEHELDEQLVVVWRAIGPKARASFKPGERRSRAETFAEWCHDHSADARSIYYAAQSDVSDLATSGETTGEEIVEMTFDVGELGLDHLPPVVAARLAARAPGSCLAKWGRRPAHRKECPGCREASEVPF